MTHTPTLAPCSMCDHQAVAYRAPCGIGYLIECSNADCVSRHKTGGIVQHVAAQSAAAIWNRRQGVSAHGTSVSASPVHHIVGDSRGYQVGGAGKAAQISPKTEGQNHV
ncbi:MAG: hypothetical protein VXW65_01520 [Pseudomonadota bacterium]|nr:hypothetical protein [Pseudomonadota bacterium]